MRRQGAPARRARLLVPAASQPASQPQACSLLTRIIHIRTARNCGGISCGVLRGESCTSIKALPLPPPPGLRRRPRKPSKPGALDLPPNSRGGQKRKGQSHGQLREYMYLQVTPMHKKTVAGTPYVALCLGICRSSLEPGHTLNAVFELSIYNHSKGMMQRYISMYPRGDKYSTDCLSLFLHLDMDVSNEIFSESGKVVDMTLSILDQKDGKFFTLAQGLVVLGGTIGWGWSDFFALTKLKDISRGYLVGLSCVVKADFTIVGSSNDG